MTLFRVGSGLLQPELRDILEGFRVGDIIDEDDGMGSAVVGLGDASESLLACGVPDLQFGIVLVDDEGSAWRGRYLKRKSIPMVEM